MTSTPEFKPGDVVWHVRHGKVTLEDGIPGIDGSLGYHLGEWFFCLRDSGKEHNNDVGRVLYTLDEARQYGWLVEPRVVEFDAEVYRYHSDFNCVLASDELNAFNGKRVRVTVREVME